MACACNSNPSAQGWVTTTPTITSSGPTCAGEPIAAPTFCYSGVCDERFRTLEQASKLNLIGVRDGEKCLMTLGGNPGLIHLGGDGQAYSSMDFCLPMLPVYNSPQLNGYQQPILDGGGNPVYQAPGSFPYFIVATPGAVVDSVQQFCWNFIAAAGAGDKYLMLNATAKRFEFVPPFEAGISFTGVLPTTNKLQSIGFAEFDPTPDKSLQTRDVRSLTGDGLIVNKVDSGGVPYMTVFTATVFAGLVRLGLDGVPTVIAYNDASLVAAMATALATPIDTQINANATVTSLVSSVTALANQHRFLPLATQAYIYTASSATANIAATTVAFPAGMPSTATSIMVEVDYFFNMVQNDVTLEAYSEFHILLNGKEIAKGSCHGTNDGASGNASHPLNGKGGSVIVTVASPTMTVSMTLTNATGNAVGNLSFNILAVGYA